MDKKLLDKKSKLMKEVLGYTLTESKVLSLLEYHGFLTIKKLTDYTRLDRTSVQKFATRLMNKGLIKRKQMNLKRGYCFVYYNTIDLTQDVLTKLYDELNTKVKLVMKCVNLKDKRSIEQQQFDKDWLDYERDKH